ncbi:hypothetical protein L195_g029787, partial [Trifolium pratense]
MKKKELVLRTNYVEEAHNEEDKEEDKDKLFQDYVSQQMENEKFLQEPEYMLSPEYEMLATDQASIDKIEAQCGDQVEKVYDVERQLVEIEIDRRDAEAIKPTS